MQNEIGGRVLVFDRGVLEDVDFLRASFDTLTITGSLLVRCDFRGIGFEPRWQALFSARPQNIFRECIFDRADLRRLNPGQARFEACSFADANLDGWTSYCAEFIDCRFTGRITNARFHGRPWGPDAENIDPPRDKNEFRGNDFTHVELKQTVFVSGIDVLAQHWPEEGYVYLDRIHQRITRAHAEVMRWRDLEGRKAALALLQATSLLYGKQREVILRKGDPAVPTPPDVEQRVLDSLSRVL